MSSNSEAYIKEAEKLVNDYFTIFKIEVPAGMELLGLNLRNYEWAKKCALIAVDEKIASILHQKQIYSSMVAWKLNDGKAGDDMRDCCDEHIKGLQDFKKTIETLVYLP
jgi:hypothetical protein